MNRMAPIVLPALVLALGCSASGSAHTLVVGNEETGGAGGAAGRAGHEQGSGGRMLVLGDAAVSKPLSARIESPQGVAVEFVTLSCANDCADVLAVAKGGVGPYAFAWEDGSTDPARHVCPTTTTRYDLTVKDAGIRSGEFPRPPATATAALTANVIQCPLDAGTVGPLPDATPPSGPPVYWATWTAVTIANPGAAQGTLSPPGGDVQVSFAGQVGPSSAISGDTTLSFVGPVLFLPESTYVGPAIPNPPPQTGMITIWDVTSMSQTITFSASVRDPLIAVVALQETWTFDVSPTVLTSGPNQLPYPLPLPSSLTVSGNDMSGAVGNGVVELRGTFTSIQFSVPRATTGSFTGFTVGIRGRG